MDGSLGSAALVEGHFPDETRWQPGRYPPYRLPRKAAVVVNSILEDVGNLPFLSISGLTSTG
jgi:hypothetical protein